MRGIRLCDLWPDRYDTLRFRPVVEPIDFLGGKDLRGGPHRRGPLSLVRQAVPGNYRFLQRRAVRDRFPIEQRCRLTGVDINPFFHFAARRIAASKPSIDCSYGGSGGLFFVVLELARKATAFC